jgi:hypothetical protein
MRVESPLEDVIHITEVALAVLRLNRQVEDRLSGDKLPVPLIEVYQPSEIGCSSLKLLRGIAV